MLWRRVRGGAPSGVPDTQDAMLLAEDPLSTAARGPVSEGETRA